MSTVPGETAASLFTAPGCCVGQDPRLYIRLLRESNPYFSRISTRSDISVFFINTASVVLYFCGIRPRNLPISSDFKNRTGIGKYSHVHDNDVTKLPT